MDASITTSWCSCNEEAQWLYECNNDDEINMNNNNNNNEHSNKKQNNKYDNKNNNAYSNNINNNNNSNNNVTQVTFNQCKANEMRQTHLQRQRELQQHQQTSASQSTTAQHQSVISEKSHTTQHYSNSSALPPAHRVTRRKQRLQRLQRQKPTELDDADFAYAADLEEEDEDEDDDVVVGTPPHQQQQSPTAAPLLGLSRSEQVASTPPPAYANKRLQHLQQQMHSSTPFFDGRPLSLPNTTNSYVTTTTSMMNIHQQHLQNQQQQQHHYQHPQQQQSQYHHLPPHRERRLRHEESFDSSTTNTTNTTDTATSPASPALRRHNFSLLKRGNSTHSESSSHYSSLDSLLEARKPDPEAILINLGFGPVGSQDILSRIPKRFLKPSQVRGIDTEAFIRRIQLASNLADHSVMGYRGLTGNPDIPPSRIVAKIMHRFEVNERKKSMGSIEQTI